MTPTTHFDGQLPGAPPPALLYHVPQHSRREKLRFFGDAAGGGGFYGGDSYSPGLYTAVPAHMAGGGGGGGGGFSLSLSSPPAPSSSAAAAKRPAVVGPYGPFTGYAAVLGRSRFLGPAQRLMEEMCDVGGVGRQGDGDDGVLDAVDMEMDVGDVEAAAGDPAGAEQHWRKTRLLSLMEEVCKRYKQYYQQAQAVIGSFETVAGLSTAAPYAGTALRAMAKHFKALKLTITAQLRAAAAAGKHPPSSSKDLDAAAAPAFGLSPSGGRALAVSFPQPQSVWRPQRGLPERAVAVLRAWLFEHFLHPYPSDSDKQMLAKQTGLTRNQVSNWFINARVRLWKPMVEEIHNLEMRQLQKHPPPPPPDKNLQQQQSSDSSAGGLSDCPPGEAPGLTPISYYDGGIFSLAGAAAPSNVSLTLGLHQNNSSSSRPCLIEPIHAEPVPANLVRRFGLEDVNDSYIVSPFEAGQHHHHRHFMAGGYAG